MSVQYPSHLYIRVDRPLKADLDKAAEHSGVTVSTFARQALRTVLDSASKPSPSQRDVNTNLDIVAMRPVQMRMARTALGWGVRDLAERAGIAANTVSRIENGADAKHSTVEALRLVLEDAGVEFTADGRGYVGVLVQDPPNLAES